MAPLRCMRSEARAVAARATGCSSRSQAVAPSSMSKTMRGVGAASRRAARRAPTGPAARSSAGPGQRVQGGPDPGPGGGVERVVVQLVGGDRLVALEPVREHLPAPAGLVGQGGEGGERGPPGLVVELDQLLEGGLQHVLGGGLLHGLREGVGVQLGGPGADEGVGRVPTEVLGEHRHLVHVPDRRRHADARQDPLVAQVAGRRSARPPGRRHRRPLAGHRASPSGSALRHQRRGDRLVRARASAAARCQTWRSSSSG